MSKRKEGASFIIRTLPVLPILPFAFIDILLPHGHDVKGNSNTGGVVTNKKTVTPAVGQDLAFRKDEQNAFLRESSDYVQEALNHWFGVKS